MAAAYRAASPLIAGSGTSPTGTEPAGTVSGDVLLALFAVGSASATCDIPAGWTSLFSGVSSAPSFRYNLAIIARGGSAPSLAFSQTGTVYRELYIVGFSGVDGTTPINAQVDGGNTFSTTTVDPPAVTPSVADAMIAAIFVAWAGSGGGGFTAPANYTLRTNNAAGNDGGIITRLLSGGSGVAEDPGAVTGAGTVGDVHTFTIALKPAASGSQGGPGISTVRFGTTATGTKTGKAAAASTVRLTPVVTGVGVERHSGASSSTLHLVSAVAGFKTGHTTHEEASALPPFTTLVDGTVDQVRLQATAAGGAVRGGPAAATIRLTPAVAGRKTALVAAGATVRLPTAVTGRKGASAPATAQVRLQATVTGTQAGVRGGASSSTLRLGTTATGRKTGQTAASATVKLAPAVAGRKSGIASAIATVRFGTTATGTQLAQRSGPSSALVRFTTTATGRKAASAPHAATVRFTTQAAGAGAAPHAGPSTATVRLLSSATGRKSGRGPAAIAVAFVPTASGSRAALGACAASVHLNATVQGRATRRPVITGPAFTGHIATGRGGTIL